VAVGRGTSVTESTTGSTPTSSPGTSPPRALGLLPLSGPRGSISSVSSREEEGEESLLALDARGSEETDEESLSKVRVCVRACMRACVDGWPPR
jgi:hypothetical protein